MAIIRRGSMKPPFSAWRFNPSHPFSKEMVMAYIPGGTNYWGSSVPGVNRNPPQPIWGKVNPRLVIDSNNGNQIIPSSNRDGEAIKFNTNTCWLKFNTADWLPTQHITILIIRRKLDTTNRNCNTINSVTNRSSVDTSQLAIAMPLSDGVIYWDFGWNGGAAPNRFTKSGLSFSTTIPEKWVFTAGERGMAIWQNGVKVASHSTAVTRTATTGTADKFLINCSNPSSSFGDVQEINFLQINDVQWDDALCQAWSVEPYAHLYTDPDKYSSIISSVGVEKSYAFVDGLVVIA